MFESMTFEKLLNDALKNVSSDIDKREGSVVYDAIAPACAELAKAYIELDRVLDESFADTASREFLIRRASERGLSPYSAVCAKVLARFTGSFVLNEGARFNLGELNYIYEGESVSDEEDGVLYILRCETSGTVGNVDSGRLIPIDNISGLEKAEVTGVFSFGENEEETETFRLRYFEYLKGVAFGGNIADYKVKVKALDGVGCVKVYPVWNGGGTVKLVITDSEHSGNIADSFVESVAQQIDPANNSGQGIGIAPIGHKVTVEGAVGIDVSVLLSGVTYIDGYSFQRVETAVLEEVREYFTELNKTFENEDNIIIYLYTLAAEILSVKGILNFSGISIQGGNGNYRLGRDEVINIAGVTVSEV